MEVNQNLREKFEQILNLEPKKIEEVIIDLHQFFFKYRNSKKLYRYRDFDSKNYNLDSIRNEKMYFSKPDNFNDPHDSLVFIDSNKVDSELGKHNNHIFSEKGFVNQIREVVDIACLCQDFNSTLMWAHYANNHSGFVLEYDLSVLGENTSVIICPVIYSENRFDSTDYYIKFINEVIKCRNFGVKYDVFNKIDLLQLIKPFVYKSNKWKYEKEWRIIRNHRHQEVEPFFLEIKPTAVFMGDKIDKPNKDKLIEISIEKELPIYQMFVDYSSDEYKLSCKKYKQ